MAIIKALNVVQWLLASSLTPPYFPFHIFHTDDIFTISQLSSDAMPSFVIDTDWKFKYHLSFTKYIMYCKVITKLFLNHLKTNNTHIT